MTPLAVCAEIWVVCCRGLRPFGGSAHARRRQGRAGLKVPFRDGARAEQWSATAPCLFGRVAVLTRHSARAESEQQEALLNARVSWKKKCKNEREKDKLGF